MFGLMKAGHNVGTRFSKFCAMPLGGQSLNPDLVVVNDEHLGSRSARFIAIATTVFVDVLIPDGIEGSHEGRSIW